jgi:Polyketide cyclase / dehydrase and lipid transport
VGDARGESASDTERPLWEKEESVEAAASAAFVFRHWTDIRNMAADPGIDWVETDGPHRDRPGMRGRTHLAGGGTTDWVVAEVEPGRRVVIDIPLRDATLRFEFRVEERAGGGSVLTQRVSLFGPNAGEYLKEVEEGFATSLRDGMRAVRDRIDEAAQNAGPREPGPSAQ